MAKPLSFFVVYSSCAKEKSVKINMGKPYSLICLLFHCIHMSGCIAELLQNCMTPRMFAYPEWKKFTRLLKIINTRLRYRLLQFAPLHENSLHELF